MISEENPVNPYVIGVWIEREDFAFGKAGVAGGKAEIDRPRPLWKVIVCWTFVCCLSAVPECGA